LPYHSLFTQFVSHPNIRAKAHYQSKGQNQKLKAEINKSTEKSVVTPLA